MVGGDTVPVDLVLCREKRPLQINAAMQPPFGVASPQVVSYLDMDIHRLLSTLDGIIQIDGIWFVSSLILLGQNC